MRLGHARDIAARLVKARDETELDRIAARFEDDWNGRDRRLCRERRRAVAGNDRHLMANQIGCQRRQSVIVTFRPAINDRYVSTLDIADLTQTPAEGGD